MRDIGRASALRFAEPCSSTHLPLASVDRGGQGFNVGLAKGQPSPAVQAFKNQATHPLVRPQRAQWNSSWRKQAGCSCVHKVPSA